MKKKKATKKTKEPPYRMEVEMDGKREIDYGSESLDKKSIKKRWQMLKSELSSDKSIIPVLNPKKRDEEDEQSGMDQQQQPGQPSPAAAGQDPAAEDQDPSDTLEAGAEEAVPEEGQPSEEGEPMAQQPEKQAKQPDAESGKQGEQDPLEELVQYLKEVGYKDSEIRFIVHNQAPTEDQHLESVLQEMQAPDEGAADANGADDDSHRRHEELSFADRQHETDYNKRRRELELEHLKEQYSTQRKLMVDDAEHKRRLLDQDAEHKRKLSMAELEHKLRSRRGN